MKKVIDREGQIMQVVQDFHSAWHASPDNQRSVGIEIVNWGTTKKIDNRWFNYNGSREIEENDVIDVSTGLNDSKIYEVWSLPENAVEQEAEGGKEKFWQKYTDEQYTSLSKLLSYLEEKFGIPHESFEYPIPGKTSEYNQYGFYFAPQRRDWQNGGNTQEWQDYEKVRVDFSGIYGHHNVSSKYDPGPHLDLHRLNLLNN